jgi:hypothetical protein
MHMSDSTYHITGVTLDQLGMLPQMFGTGPSPIGTHLDWTSPGAHWISWRVKLATVAGLVLKQFLLHSQPLGRWLPNTPSQIIGSAYSSINSPQSEVAGVKCKGNPATLKNLIKANVPEYLITLGAAPVASELQYNSERLHAHRILPSEGGRVHVQGDKRCKTDNVTYLLASSWLDLTTPKNAP